MTTENSQAPLPPQDIDAATRAGMAARAARNIPPAPPDPLTTLDARVTALERTPCPLSTIEAVPLQHGEVLTIPPPPRRPTHRDHARAATSAGVALLLLQAIGVLVNASATGQIGVPLAWEPYLLAASPLAAYLVSWGQTFLAPVARGN